MTMTEAKKDWSERSREIGASAYQSIAEMVAALNCDYDRLDELRAMRDDWASETESEPGNFSAVYADEADELADLADAAGECESREDAEQRIQEDALSVQVRSEWYDPAHYTIRETKPAQFELLLTTGGPAVRIIGDLEYGEPVSARLEVQDWFQPWTQYMPADEDVLLDYARCFYYGE